VANQFTSNPISLDTVWTAGAIPAGLTALTSPQQFRYVKWINPVTVGDTVVITDLNGNVLLTATCAVAKQDIDLWHSSRPIAFKDNKWVLLTLASGKVYLYR